jgi:DNA-directed RNA polymerase subunit RPC12/RpoP
MRCLKDQGELATGDPIICESCSAIFNKHSKYEDKKEDQVWACEFCNHKNVIQIDPEEVPKTQAVNYIIEAAAQI